jgi:hypothetical protein
MTNNYQTVKILSEKQIKARKSNQLTFILSAMLVLVSNISHAALVDEGNGIIYSTESNLSWAKDFAAFKNAAAADSNLINKILAANTATIYYAGSFHANYSGVVYNQPNGLNTLVGTNHNYYFLSAADFDTTSGTMDWFGAAAWVNYLNSINYEGFHDWRLPATTPANGIAYDLSQNSADLGAINSNQDELAGLFQKDLAGVSLNASSSSTDNYGPFNVASPAYFIFGANSNNSYLVSKNFWTGTELPNAGNTYNFTQAFIYGYNNVQLNENKNFLIQGGAVFSALTEVVRDGPSLTAVPLPGSGFMLLTGLIMLRKFFNKNYC